MAVDPQFGHPDILALMWQHACFNAGALEHRDDGLGVRRAGQRRARIIGSQEFGMQHIAHAAGVSLARAGIIAVDELALLDRRQPRFIGPLARGASAERQEEDG